MHPQIFKYCPNHTSMEILFIQMMHTSQFHKLDPWLWPVLCFRVTLYHPVLRVTCVTLNRSRNGKTRARAAAPPHLHRIAPGARGAFSRRFYADYGAVRVRCGSAVSVRFCTRSDGVLSASAGVESAGAMDE